MPKISSYQVKSTLLSDRDKWIGTDSSGNTTKNFTPAGIAKFINETDFATTAGQFTFKWQGSTGPREVGSLSFAGFGGDGTNLSALTTFLISDKSLGETYILDYLLSTVNTEVIMVAVDNPNNFVIANISSIVPSVTYAGFNDVTWQVMAANGVLDGTGVYAIANYSQTAGGGATIDSAAANNPVTGIGITTGGLVSTGDVDVTGTTTTDDLLVGTATGGVANSIATITNTSTSTGTNVNTWIDVNRAHSSTATGDTYGGVVRVVSNSSSLDGGIVGLNPVGRQSGSGGAEYVYGSLNTAEQTGSGNIDFLVASSNKAKSNGNGVGTIDYVRGVSFTASQSNANSTVNYLQGAHMTAQLDAGTVGDVEITLLDWDQTGGTITGDLSYLRIQNDTVSNVTGTARSIWSLSTLPSEFAGSIESTSFIKTGGTSSQFLKADGSVDTNIYLTSSDVTSSQWDDVTGGINYASGNVGIGNTSPTKELEIGTNAAAETEFRMHSDVSGKYFNIQSAGNFTSVKTTGSQNFILDSSGTSGYLTFVTNAAERMRVNYNGNVGIGTTSPQYNLDIQSESPAIRIKDISDNNSFLVGADNGGAYLGTFTFDSLRFLTDSSEKMRIKQNGNVGIGTTSPSEKLHVVGYAKTSIGLKAGNYTILSESGNETSLSNTAYYPMFFKTNNSTRMTISNAGNVGIGTTDPKSKLDVDGGVKIGDDTDTASADKVGTMRYRTGTDYVEVDGTELVTNGDFSQIGTEEVSNGDFSNGSTGWTISSGASVGVDKLDIDAGAFDFFATQTALTNGLNYKVTLDAEVTSGDILLYTGTQFASINSSGSYTFYTTSDSAQIRFRSGGSGLVGSIDNVSIKEVGQDWTLGTGWSIEDDGGNFRLVSQNGGNYETYQPDVFENGKKYRISFDVTEFISGQFQIRFHTADPFTITSEGSYVTEGVANGARLYLLGFGTFNGKVDNFSAVEVTEEDASYADMCMQIGASTYEWVNIIKNTY